MTARAVLERAHAAVGKTSGSIALALASKKQKLSVAVVERWADQLREAAGDADRAVIQLLKDARR